MFQVLKQLKWRQIITTVSACYVMVCVGMCIVWTSPVLRELRGPNSPIKDPPTTVEQDWMGSLLLLGGTFGPMIAYPLSSYVGRRTIILTMGVPLITGWIIAGCATTVYHMYAARFLWGCTTGISFMVLPIYIGEIAEDSIRGALGAIIAQFITLGLFLGYLVGRFADYWQLAITGGLLSVISLGLAWPLPETPLYLVYKGRKEAASLVLQKLRAASEEQVSSELVSLEMSVEKDYREKPKIRDLWATKATAKALALCIFLNMMIQLCGINVILFYMEELFVRLKVKMSAADAPIAITAVQAITSCVTVFIVERLGRRLLLYSTLMVMTFCMVIMGVYSLLESYYQYDMGSFTIVPMLCVVIFLVMFTWGVGPIPVILVSEMFRPKVKCLASAICSSCNWFSGFLLTRFFSNLTGECGQYSGFWLLAVFCAAGAIVTFSLLRETKGKTFDEIQDMLENKTSAHKHTLHVDVNKPSQFY